MMAKNSRGLVGPPTRLNKSNCLSLRETRFAEYLVASERVLFSGFLLKKITGLCKIRRPTLVVDTRRHANQKRRFSSFAVTLVQTN